MSTEVKLEFIDAGFRDILQSQGVRELVTDITQGIAQRAGDTGFYNEVMLGQAYNANRWVGFVGCETYEAMRAQATDKVLTRAVMA